MSKNQPKRTTENRPVNSDDMTRFGDSLSDFDADFDVSEPLQSSRPNMAVLGEYMLLDRLGIGGMGQVFRAEHRTMNRHVALKILNRKIASRRDLLELFFHEIRAVAKLMHPNIVTAFDAGTYCQVHYLVMELVVGDVLSQRISKYGPMSTGEAVSVLEQAASALSYAHGQGIVHRDIKPSNLMLTQDGTLKILDFGLAMIGQTVDAMNEEATEAKSTLLGTPEYMSPEQIENPNATDGRSDLYSLGATLFYLLTGKPMFQGDKMQVAMAQLRQKPLALYLARSDTDLRLDAIFQRLVAKKPSERYRNAEDLLRELRQLNLVAERAVSTGKIVLNSAAAETTSIVANKSTLSRKSQVVAIDLGMLASTAAVYDQEAGPQIVIHDDGNATQLRNMLWSAGEQVRIGADALELRKTHPEHVFHSIQRWIGARQITRPFGGRICPPEVLLAALLRKIMWAAGKQAHYSSHAILTVPSCYDQLHRRSIQQACQIAGINLVQLVDKPIAAALNWWDVNRRLNAVPNSPQKILVVHLGGSGMEASIVQCSRGSIVQLSNAGDWKFGLLRWQHAVAEFFTKRLEQKTGKSIKDDVVGATRLQRTIELAIDHLTRSHSVELRFEWMGATIRQSFSQQDLMNIAERLVKELENAIKQALKVAHVEAAEIRHVLLVGNMMRIKPLQDVVKSALGAKVSATVLDKTDLAMGAAIAAQKCSELTTQSDLPEVTGCASYDIAVVASESQSSRRPHILIPKGTALPHEGSRSLRFKNAGCGHPAAVLQLIESTSKGRTNWHKLGNCLPNEYFPKRTESDYLNLRFQIDGSGVLHSQLVWPAGNQAVPVQLCSESLLLAEEILDWQKWLETILLCSGS
ncbi:MAG: Hsp70 family protein [Planctomycetales bacterium]|nr:Hsp70 family protein [Planctomycetales bacterium]